MPPSADFPSLRDSHLHCRDLAMWSLRSRLSGRSSSRSVPPTRQANPAAVWVLPTQPQAMVESAISCIDPSLGADTVCFTAASEGFNKPSKTRNLLAASSTAHFEYAKRRPRYRIRQKLSSPRRARDWIRLGLPRCCRYLSTCRGAVRIPCARPQLDNILPGR